MRSVLSILAGACCASLALAQPATTTSGSTTTTVQYYRSSTVIGQSLLLGRETVGKVTEVVFNSNGCIEYLVVQEAEGFVVVPYSVVTINAEQRNIVVQSSTVTVDRLRELRFTEGRFPNFADPTFTQRVQTVWGAGATRSGAGTSGTTRPADRSGTAPGSGTTQPDRKGAGTTTPDRKGSDTTNPDRKGSGTTTSPDKTDRAADPKATPPAKDNPGKDNAGKDNPRKDNPKKDKDKDR
jgi:hypothetical protein